MSATVGLAQVMIVLAGTLIPAVGWGFTVSVFVIWSEKVLCLTVSVKVWWMP